jgi:hypothetical protein
MKLLIIQTPTVLRYLVPHKDKKIIYSTFLYIFNFSFILLEEFKMSMKVFIHQ